MIKLLPNVAKQALLYGASIALMKGISLLMLPFITAYLPVESYGRLEVVTSLAVISSVLIGMGLDSALFRFAGTSDQPQESRRLSAELFYLALLIGAIAGIGGWLTAGSLASSLPGQLSEYEIRLVMLTLSLEGAISIPLGWMRMRDRASLFFFASTGRALLQALLVLLFLSQGRGVAGVLEAGVVAAASQALCIGVLHLRDTGVKLSIRKNTAYRSIIYSLPIVLSGMLAFVWNGLDRLILADFSSLVDVAHFGVAAKFSLAVILLLQPFNMWWLPRRFNVLKQVNGQQQAVKIISIGIVLTLMIAVFIGLATPPLIAWLLPESYHIAGLYAFGLVMVMALKEMAELVNIGCFVGKTTKAQLLINLSGAAVCTLAMYVLAPRYAAWGIIMALLSAHGLRLLLFFLTSQYFLPLPYPTHRLLLLAALSIAFLSLGSQTDTVFQQFLVTLMAMSSLLAGSLLLKLVPFPKRLRTS
ncbi:MAG: oligosaccharide flippase family protein [Cycloclasticus sp.]